MRVLKFILLLVATTATLNASAKKTITITTIPENAEIKIDGAVVGIGSYQVIFDKKTDFYLVTVSAPGYIEKRFRLLKSNPKASVLYTLPVDEALAASTGSEDGDELANTWMDVTCRDRLTEDQIWKRLMSVATTYFDNIEVRDKASGWIKTRWKVTKFSHQTVRTRLEIRMSFVDDEHITFKARISSEIKENDCTSDNCYKPYSRVLRKFEPMIQELQTSVGGGE